MKVSFGGTKKEFKIASIAVILIAVMTSVWIISQTNSTRLVVTPEIQKCVEERRGELSSGLGYATGEIMVEFKGGLSGDEIREFINSYGLEIKRLSVQQTYAWGLLKVENGKEIEWICEFETNDIVESANLNGISQAT